jgi:hypothetical protein
MLPATSGKIFRPMRSVRLLSLIALLALVGMQPAHAQTPPASPYAVTVPVPDTSAAVRSQAFASALTQVLARAMNGQDPRTLAGFDDTLKQAPGLVQQYQYSRSHSPETPLNLNVSFDPASVRRILASAASSAAAPADGQAPAADEGPSQASFWISGVHSAADYAAVLAAFGNEPAVRSVDTVAARDDGIQLHVNAIGPMPRIVAALGAAAHLPADPASHPGTDFSLRWSP